MNTDHQKTQRNPKVASTSAYVDGTSPDSSVPDVQSAGIWSWLAFSRLQRRRIIVTYISNHVLLNNLRIQHGHVTWGDMGKQWSC